MAGPVRQCLACRERAEPSELIRLAAYPGSGLIIPDLPGKLPGRGAWVHAKSACIARLEKDARRVGHALKTDVKTTDLAARIRQAVVAATLDGISMASASGALVGGHDQLKQALLTGRVVGVVVASDASKRTLESLRLAAEDDVDFVELEGVDKATLGERTGRGSRAAVGVVSSRASTHLRRQLRRLSGLG